jgi:hypothetical protein
LKYLKEDQQSGGGRVRKEMTTFSKGIVEILLKPGAEQRALYFFLI